MREQQLSKLDPLAARLARGAQVESRLPDGVGLADVGAVLQRL